MRGRPSKKEYSDEYKYEIPTIVLRFVKKEGNTNIDDINRYVMELLTGDPRTVTLGVQSSIAILKRDHKIEVFDNTISYIKNSRKSRKILDEDSVSSDGREYMRDITRV
jgi:hypothetical protein